MVKPLHPHFEKGVVVMRIPLGTPKSEEQAAYRKAKELAKKHSQRGVTECDECGAKLKLSKKGNQYCSELCWLGG